MGTKKFNRYYVLQNEKTFVFEEYKQAKCYYHRLEAPKTLFGITPRLNKKVTILSEETANNKTTKLIGK